MTVGSFVKGALVTLAVAAITYVILRNFTSVRL
jgi:hypothetical protein